MYGSVLNGTELALVIVSWLIAIVLVVVLVVRIILFCVHFMSKPPVQYEVVRKDDH